jgi:CcmD family protein
MTGITAVYVVFALVLASIFAYVFLLSRRQRDLDAEIEDLRRLMESRAKGPGAQRERR